MRLIPVLTIALLLLSFTAMQAQETFQPKQLDDPAKGIVYNKEFAVGLRMHTNGFSLGVNLGEIKTYYRTRYWHFEIGELQHPKEFRQSFDTPSTVNGRISRAFKYGKENSLLVLRAAIGEKRYFSEKAKYKGVAVGLSYEAGATLGMLKPYYLELRAGDGRASITTKYSETTAARFLDIWQIQGASWASCPSCPVPTSRLPSTSTGEPMTPTSSQSRPGSWWMPLPARRRSWWKHPLPWKTNSSSSTFSYICSSVRGGNKNPTAS
jgi:hypothetical protein